MNETVAVGMVDVPEMEQTNQDIEVSCEQERSSMYEFNRCSILNVLLLNVQKRNVILK